MSEPGPKPATASQPEPAQGGALWALIVGGAILVVAALLIFWPGGDATSAAGSGKGSKGSAGQQASLAQGGGGPEGQALGVSARDYDPNRGNGKVRINPNILPVGPGANSLAPPRKVKPEPTSFPSASAEIAYWEKKLAAARQELTQRTLFLERMQKVKENARTSEQIELAERRGVVVQKNYDEAKKTVEELEQKVAGLKEKQRQTGL
ncbi:MULTISPECIES: hypothetical protein [Nannocystis]|uniref:Uncharacterized protein n=1 Tax=Nannocystis radixulma TaxID=2995305 RepID=A0ABT5BI02_9BACT|nr:MULTISPECIES: hypothetical protein [Nannocystis]MCY1056857.1 hypothetical protein [Nannocystis sp. SCPEA4]MDC0673787.1 hypothetical protein [Nannocystis radixulma]